MPGRRPPIPFLAASLLWAVLPWRHVTLAAVAAAAGQQPPLDATDVALQFAPDRFYNPSLVAYGNQATCAIKHTEHKKIKSKIWWFNQIQLCTGSMSDLQSLSCDPFMPWGSGLDECELDSRVREGKVDSQGIGDTKLWVWPGKGVYAIFGHKPPRNSNQGPSGGEEGGEAAPAATTSSTGGEARGSGGSNRYCTSQLVYHQWLVQVWADPAQPADDPWRLLGLDPLPLRPDPSSHAYPATLPYIQEKNWMPWIYKDPDTSTDRVMVTYMVMPHTVWEILPSGAAVPRWVTPSPALFTKFTKFDVHGGPPVVWVPPALAGAEQQEEEGGYYLGVMHHIERWQRYRLYRHFAFKFKASPPFEVFAISDELPLIYNTTYKGRMSKVAFASGLYLDPDSTRVYLTYGAADVNARLFTITLDALQSLFTGNVAFRRAGQDVASTGDMVPGSSTTTSSVVAASTQTSITVSAVSTSSVERVMWEDKQPGQGQEEEGGRKGRKQQATSKGVSQSQQLQRGGRGEEAQGQERKQRTARKQEKGNQKQKGGKTG